MKRSSTRTVRQLDLEAPPSALVDAAGKIAFGRYAHPIDNPQIAALGRVARLRTKRWHYTSVTLPDHFLAIALADLGFAAHAFVYLVPKPFDADDRRPAVEHASLSLTQSLRPVLRMAESSVQGETRWRRRGERVTTTWHADVTQRDAGDRQSGRADVGEWRINLDWPLGKQRLTGEVVVRRPPGTQCFALAHPVTPEQPAYTHKDAGLPARVDLTLTGKGSPTERIVDEGVAAVDWTLGWMRRETTWKWASAAWRTAEGKIAGLNLSADVYEDDDGHGRENALWLDGRVFPLRGVRFQVPVDATSAPWRIRSIAGDEVNLTFTPRGAREERLNIQVVVSQFVQPYGTFSGHVRLADGRKMRVNNVFGVVEDHVSRW